MAEENDAEYSFEVLKLLVRSQFNTEIGFGITTSVICANLAAGEAPVGRALSALEVDGDGWGLFEEDGECYWSGDSIDCDEPLPACYHKDTAETYWPVAGARAYSCTPAGDVVKGISQPPIKKARLGNGLSHATAAVASSGDPFEDLKCLLHGLVAQAGQSGVSSGKLGYELGADRKSITAALYGCQSDGKVKNMNEGAKPHWVSVKAPPANAHLMEIPEKYGYKGAKAMQADVKQKVAMPVTASKQLTAGAPLTSGVDNPIGMLNEWSQKNQKKLEFKEVSGKGGFGCMVIVDQQQVALENARNKKAAKTAAATAAVQALGLA